jgi:hypothetical protein
MWRCVSCKNRSFGGTYRHHHQHENDQLAGNNVSSRMVSSGMLRRVALAASVVPNSPIIVSLMKEALGFSETSALTRTTRRNIPEDTILHSHSRENLKSYNVSSNLSVTAKDVPSSPFLPPWWWRGYVPPKGRFLQGPHGVTSQKKHSSTILSYFIVI